ncbi:hypothetical protein GBAR_LOCUS1806 [Geodia barretti]|uniref:Uncharacterized protein n=2 Tax=Geodia barretti TaxID=519541 RepID=A0AA35QXH3_GEOBA|nr:hypothetical protein GBAR_LOCUS1806 [Geodia barretti]
MLSLCTPTEGDGVGAEEVPGDRSRDKEHPLSVTAVTLCSHQVPQSQILSLFSPALSPSSAPPAAA